MRISFKRNGFIALASMLSFAVYAGDNLPLATAASGTNGSIQVSEHGVDTSNEIQQARVIQGTVLEEGTNEPLIGVNVVVKGTTIGTTTDVEGKYSIRIPSDNAVLVFSYIGQKTEEYSVKGLKSLDVIMKSDATMLSEVVVYTGYMTQKKADLTGSVALADSKDIKKTSANVMKAMQGKMAGVKISNNGGNPAEDIGIQIRGLSSLSGAVTPLIVLDGMPAEGLNLRDINSGDIESIQVLKDAASASIYGARASGGVILVQTKKGKAGKTTIDYNGSVSVSSIINRPEMMNATEWGTAAFRAAAYDEWAYGSGLLLPNGFEYEYHRGDNGMLVLDNMKMKEYLDNNQLVKATDTNWMDEIFRTAVSTNHQLTISNGSDKAKSLFSLGYTNNQGTQIHSFFKQYSVRANTEYSLIKDRLKVGENLAISYLQYKSQWETFLAMIMPPMVPVYDVNGNWAGPAGLDDFDNPEQKAWDSYVMYDERTQFNLQGNPMALLMYLPGYVNTHEGVYSHVRYDKVARKRLIEMPATFEFDNGVAVVITEAAIRDYAGMYLVKEKGGLVGKLSPKLGQEKIKVETDSFPHRTPWRVISVADRVGGLLETNILTSLNEPCRIEDTSWIKPCRTTFTWWNGNVVPDSTFSPGNNFDTNKYYIDFAARNGLDAHGIYGYAETPWYYDDNFNFGWAGPNADVTKPIPCLNMPRIVEYARSKGVGIHLWVHWRPLYDKLEEAFALYEGWGVKGLMVDFMDRNDQEMIRIQEEILECAARHRLFIQFHGSSKPSGLVRTYPNEFTREGTLNYEVCKWDTLVNADHDIAIPFTRMLAGATDYHLGGFRALPRSEFKIQYVNPHVMSTRCHMLAMYVVLENHLTSLCDTPKAYEGQPGFEVLRTVPGTWDEIRVPLAKMNEHVTVARRSGSDWWVGSLNNGAERNLKLELDFLSEGDYQATIYTDAEDVDRNPNHLDRQVRKVTRKDIIELNLAKDGGALLHIRRL